MFRMSIGMALAASAGLGGWWIPAQGAPEYSTAAAVQEPADRMPPAPWLQGDPADSIYRAGRDALSRREFLRASELFAQIANRFPRSAYAADSFYWQAFALYRLGGEPQLRRALQALQTQRQRFPKAATQGDAAALERRIQGELARQGDQVAAAQVTRAAKAAAEPPEPPEAPEPPDPPEPPDVIEAPDPRRGCEEDEDDMKVAALNALIHMDSERARPVLQRVLARRDPGSACLRRKAVFLIAQGEGEGTEDILLATARNDPDIEVREQALFWLSQVGTERAVGALDSIVRSSTDRRIQEKAVFALSQHDNPRAQQALRSYAERTDLSDDVREKVIFWLGQRGGKDNAAFLRGLYGRIKGEELRKKTMFSVSQMGGQENLTWLLGIAKDRSQPVELRKQALFWAGQGGASIADLAALYSTMTDREMREQLVFVYSQSDEPAAMDKLLDIARRDPDPELRKKALFWLGQSDDPRAAKALQDIIEQ